jgi:hypothetical protein
MSPIIQNIILKKETRKRGEHWKEVLRTTRLAAGCPCRHAIKISEPIMAELAEDGSALAYRADQAFDTRDGTLSAIKGELAGSFGLTRKVCGIDYSDQLVLLCFLNS